MAASVARRALLCKVEDVNYLSGPGKGVLLMKLDKSDKLVGFKAARAESDALVVRSSMGGEQRISPSRYELSSRGGKGREIMKRGSLIEMVLEPPPAPAPFEGS
jgi:DNA gyrase subunit A